MKNFKCEICGNKSLIKKNNKYICKFCNTKYNICLLCFGTGFILNDKGFYNCKECANKGIIKDD